MGRLKIVSPAEQVAARLRADLFSGVWKARMPGVLRLEADLGVNRKAVEAGLGILEREGLLERQGVGKRRKIVAAAVAAREAPSIRIGILASEPMAFSEGYMVELLHRLQEAGHQAFFSSKSFDILNYDVRRVARLVKETPADAWVVVSATREILEWFIAYGVPTFALFGRRRDLKIAGTGPDKVEACREVARQLVALGHRRIVLLALRSRRLPYPGAPERAFLEELEAQGIPTGRYNLPDWEESADAVDELLDSLFRVTPPTAMLIDEAYLFHAVKHHIADLGVRVPGDVSLICTDPDRTFAWCRPTIAHIAWDSRPVVRRIVRWASNVSRGKMDLRQSGTPAEFVPGGTMGPVKGASSPVEGSDDENGVRLGSVDS